VGRRRRAVEDLVTFEWTDRSVFVTGATGFLGSHLTAALVDRNANVTCLVRDEVSSSHFHRMHLGKRVTIVRGRIEDYELLERAINEHEIEAVRRAGATASSSIASSSHRATRRMVTSRRCRTPKNRRSKVASLTMRRRRAPI